MSKILAKDDLKTQSWEVTFHDLEPTFADLYIGFTEEAPIVNFKDLKFKYELRQANNIKQYGVFPPPNTRYVSTDQEFLVVERLYLEIETDYELYLWAENNKESFETTVTFTTPRPAQPYYSWTWNTEILAWEAPAAYPDDGNEYEWNEETVSWDESMAEIYE